MKRKLLILSLLVLSAVTTAQKGNIDLLKKNISDYGQAEIRFKNPGKKELAFVSGKISVYNANQDYAWALVSEADTSYMRVFPYSYVLIDPPDSKAVLSALSVEEAMNWESYPTWQQYDTIMHKLAEDYPSICRLDTIGESINGKQVLVLKISDNVQTDEAEPEVFYSSTIHGDELAGYVLMLRLAHTLLSNYASGGLEAQLIDSLEIWINPLANPDGTYYGSDTINIPRRFNASGEDLNRNFPDPTVSGSLPEKENVDMINFLKGRNFVLSANIHSGAEVLNFPWDRGEVLWDGRVHADSSWFFKICRDYVDTVHLYSTAGYLNDLFSAGSYPGVTRGDDWYEVNGSRQDYVNYERQGREVTFELSAIKQSPASDLPLLWEYNSRSLLRYLSYAFYGIHGRVIDDDTEEELEAKVYIPGHDRDSSHVYSDSLSAYFVRLLDMGTWNLEVSAEGYQTKSISGIEVSDFQQRFLEVRLRKDTSDIPEVQPGKLLLWPVPAAGSINIRVPVGFATEARIDIISSEGKLVYSRQHNLEGDLLRDIPLNGLASGLYIVKLRNPSGKILKEGIVIR